MLTIQEYEQHILLITLIHINLCPVAYCSSIPNTRGVCHDVRNKVLFKRARIQMTPRPSGEHRDVIPAVCLAAQGQCGWELVINIRCENNTKPHHTVYAVQCSTHITINS
jgi:hypothetical protein